MKVNNLHLLPPAVIDVVDKLRVSPLFGNENANLQLRIEAIIEFCQLALEEDNRRLHKEEDKRYYKNKAFSTSKRK